MAALEPMPTITLTDQEKAFFKVCTDTAATSGTVVRCAGGWVRDKILGRESDDIDLALDNVSGLQFAEAMKRFLEAEAQASGAAPQRVHISVIKANPEQSKHLETATVKFGPRLEVDMTNLRTETYAAGSRIPTVEMGTAEEDALRRDLTMNALFYNVSTEAVEDWTGRGLADLRGRVCRTPLSPEVRRTTRSCRCGKRPALLRPRRCLVCVFHATSSLCARAFVYST